MKSLKYPKELLEEAVANSTCLSDVLRYIEVNVNGGGTRSYIKSLIEYNGIDTSHFDPFANSRNREVSLNKVPASEILVLRENNSREKTHRLRRALLEIGREYICVGCGITDSWNGRPITLEINHKDQNWKNNSPENLEFLCPNCHQQKDVVIRGTVAKLGGPRKITKPKEILKNRCPECSIVISSRAKACKSHAARSSKIEWPPMEELLERLSKSNYLQLSKELNVSDNAIRKHIKNNT